ncbi:MAG: hypothetical protein CMH54_10435 [Myxococcales bacterium]|nr:hypothetical protein [Myxococcales bacterium]
MRPITIAFSGLLFLLLTPLALGATLVRGPYLQMGTSSEMTVVWRTDSPTTGRVLVGPHPLVLDSVHTSETEATQHAIRITGLEADQKYYYAVGTADEVLAGGEEEFFFVTAPPVGTSNPTRLWIVGDSGTGTSAQQSVTDAMLQYSIGDRPDIYLHMGDMAYSSGTDNEFQERFFDMYQPILQNTVCWPTMGNHEGKTSTSASESGPYYDAYVLPRAGEAGGLPSGTEAYYSFDYANIHFVVLDSHQSSRDVDGPMLTWLQEDLEATDQEWLIAYWHHPPYSKGTHDSDTEGALIDMRENALPILEAAGVDLVLAGHSHIYERSYLVNGAYDTPTTAEGHILDSGNGQPGGDGPYIKKTGLNPNDGAVYIVAGHGGTGLGQDGVHPLMVFIETELGSCLIDIDGDRLTLRNVRYDGVVSDWFTIAKEEGLYLGAPQAKETLEAGATTTIRWDTVGDIPLVDLHYTLDGGEHWLPLSYGYTNSGQYGWKIPNVNTSQAAVRIRDSANPSATTGTPQWFIISSITSSLELPFGSDWKYHDQDVDPGADWNSATFDDSSWPTGPAQLGFGDGDEATTISTPSTNVPSIYFRRAVTLNSGVVGGSYKILYDDAASVWINGQLISSTNMENGLEHGTYASSSSADNTVDLEVTPSGDDNPFVLGPNIVAVMVKNRTATSSDLSFDLELTVDSETLTAGANNPPDVVDPGPIDLTVDALWEFQIVASDPDGDEILYLADLLPEGMSVDFRTGSMSWTPSVEQLGSHTIALDIFDKRGLYEALVLHLNVVPEGTVDTGTSSNDNGASTDTTHGEDIAPAPPKTSGGGCKAGSGSVPSAPLFVLVLLLVVQCRRSGRKWQG